MNRFLADIILFLAVFLLPWWLVVALATVFFFVFDTYYEFIVTGFVMDLTYGDKLTGAYDVSYIYFVAAIIFFVVLSQLKKKMRYA